ncbi:MAG: PBSX family phage terminase large subunit [Bacteroidales bacterium]|nr:PBSX family phage terminase large subunit [Bacteroidales bacterium]
MSNGQINVDVELNPAFKKIYRNESRYRVLYGGAGSGKSYFIAQELLLNMLSSRNYNYLIVRKVGRTIRHSVFRLLQTIISDWGANKEFRINKSDMNIVASTGSVLISSGLDDVEKLKSIANITNIWIEEASEITQEDFQQLDLRLRGKSKINKQITLSFNPVSSQSWLKRYFFDREPENTTIIKTTYKDNRFIDEEYKKVIEELKETDYTYYQIYGLGNWGTPGNLIYHNYKVTENMPEQFDEIIYGLDFGYNNPSALVEIGIRDENAYILSELYESKLTNADLIEKLKSLIANKNAPVYADAAEPQRIEEITRAGFNIHPADKSVKDGIDYVKRQKIYIHPDCDNVIAEMQTYKWKEDRNGNVLDEPVKFRDHLMDALRYCLYTHSKTADPSIYLI